jgi:hypothetical protein
LELMSFFLLLVVLIRSLSLSLVPVVVKTTNNRNNSSHVWDYCPFGCLLLLSLLSLVFVYLTNWTGFTTRRGKTAFLLSKTIRVSSIYVNRLLQTMIDNWHSLPNKKYGIEKPAAHFEMI